MTTITVYPPAQQGTGEFDGGLITEQKPIGFPHEYSEVRRVGPLFYWAWAVSKGEGRIGLHPHKGFEIMTYVIDGRVEHGDTLGTESAVGPGGAQVMQTGSGVSHREGFLNAEGFQIWFEPHLSEAFTRQPTYAQYEHEAFPVAEGEGVRLKTVIGEGSPISLVTDVQVWDVELEPGASCVSRVPAGYALAALAVRGDGVWQAGTDSGEASPFRHRDFVVLHTDSDTDARLTAAADADGNLRMLVIRVPAAVDYPLYRKRS